MRVFWGLIVALLAASLFFGLNAESRRRAVQRSQASVETGEIVQLGRVVDGDSVVVKNAAGENVSIRLLGVKAFSADGKDDTAAFGNLAVQKLQDLLEDKPIRVLLHSTPKDRHGRMIAELFVDDNNVGVEMIRAGVALAYTVYPFASLTIYLEEQEAARASKKGLWRNESVASRADLLAREWGRRASR